MPAPSNTSSNTLIGLVTSPDTASADPSPTEKNSHAIPPLDPPIPSRPRAAMKRYLAPDGALRPFRLLRADVNNLVHRWKSDWFFNQLILASAVYVFFTNLLPGITFSSDLYVRTDKNYGTIEVVLSTAICGLVFSLYVSLCRPSRGLPTNSFPGSLRSRLQSWE